MIDFTTNEQTTKFAAIVKTDAGPEAQEIRSRKHAEFAQDKGAAVFANLAAAEKFQTTENFDNATWSKKADLVVNGWVVYLAVLDDVDTDAVETDAVETEGAEAPVETVTAADAMAQLQAEDDPRTVKDLRAEAKAAGIKGASKMNRAALLEALAG